MYNENSKNGQENTKFHRSTELVDKNTNTNGNNTHIKSSYRNVPHDKLLKINGKQKDNKRHSVLSKMDVIERKSYYGDIKPRPPLASYKTVALASNESASLDFKKLALSRRISSGNVNNKVSNLSEKPSGKKKILKAVSMSERLDRVEKKTNHLQFIPEAHNSQSNDQIKNTLRVDIKIKTSLNNNTISNKVSINKWNSSMSMNVCRSNQLNKLHNSLSKGDLSTCRFEGNNNVSKDSDKTTNNSILNKASKMSINQISHIHNKEHAKININQNHKECIKNNEKINNFYINKSSDNNLIINKNSTNSINYTTTKKNPSTSNYNTLTSPTTSNNTNASTTIYSLTDNSHSTNISSNEHFPSSSNSSTNPSSCNSNRAKKLEQKHPSLVTSTTHRRILPRVEVPDQVVEHKRNALSKKLEQKMIRKVSGKGASKNKNFRYLEESEENRSITSTEVEAILARADPMGICESDYEEALCSRDKSVSSCDDEVELYRSKKNKMTSLFDVMKNDPLTSDDDEIGGESNKRGDCELNMGSTKGLGDSYIINNKSSMELDGIQRGFVPYYKPKSLSDVLHTIDNYASRNGCNSNDNPISISLFAILQSASFVLLHVTISSSHHSKTTYSSSNCSNATRISSARSRLLKISKRVIVLDLPTKSITTRSSVNKAKYIALFVDETYEIPMPNKRPKIRPDDILLEIGGFDVTKESCLNVYSAISNLVSSDMDVKLVLARKQYII